MLDSLNNNKSTIAAIGVASLASLYYMLSKSNEKRTRRAKLVCTCGAIEAQLYIPAANYKHIEPPCFQCTCNDCVNVVDRVLESGPSKTLVRTFCTPGAPNLILYDSEILVTKGADKIKSMKLSDKTPNRRMYSTCCGTPLGISVDNVKLNMVCYNLIQPLTELGINEIAFPTESITPTICLYAAKANVGKKMEPTKGMKMVPGNVAPKFIGVCLGRLALLAAVGSKGPGKGFPTIGEIDIGIESIKMST